MNTERLKGWLSSSSRLVVASAQLAKKQAELTTLNNVTLPRLYHAIGKRIIGSTKLPPDLVVHRDKIRELEAAIATKSEEPNSEPASGFAAKAKQIAQQAASKTAKATADAAASMKIQAAYVAVGRQAIEKYGQKALPQEFREQYEAAMQKQTLLEDAIARLNVAPRNSFVTPARLGILVVSIATLVGLTASYRGVRSLFSAATASSVEIAAGFDAAAHARFGSSGTASDEDGGADSPAPPSDGPWDVSGSQSKVRLAVAMAIGETSQHFSSPTFRGIRIGASRKDLSVAQVSPRFCKCEFAVTEEAEEESGQWPASTHALVDADTDTVVGVTARYRTSIAGMVELIRDTFGEPSAPAMRWRQPHGEVGYAANMILMEPVNVTAYRYAFPNHLAIITEATTGRDAYVDITVLDRRYVVADLMRYGAGTLHSARWLNEVLANQPYETPTLSPVPRLADTVLEVDPGSTMALLVDRTRQQQLSSTSDEEAPTLALSYDVAGVSLISHQGEIVAIADPLVSSTLGIHRLESDSQSEFSLPCTLTSTPCHLFFWLTARYVMEQQFPPHDGKAMISHPEIRWGPRGSPPSELKANSVEERWTFVFKHRLVGAGMAWTSKEGWRIVVGKNLALGASKPYAEPAAAFKRL